MTSDQPNANSALPPLLAMRGIHKRFPGVHALKGVSLDLRRGEVHALCGENGAGKSTLVHILAGVCQPDEGNIDFDGVPTVVIADEHAAQRLGIAIVFQERSLFGSLNVAENIFAARQPGNVFGHIHRRQLYAAASTLLKEVGLEFIKPQTPLADLSPAQQQMVEIAKALSLNAKLIIFDEPTAALTEVEKRSLFRVIARLREAGVGIIYISHRLEEIFEIANRVTVLKDGVGQGTFPVTDITTDLLITRMVGRDLAVHRSQAATSSLHPQVVLEVRGVTDAEMFRGTRPFLHDITFNVRAGEIVVLAGLAGAGRTELALSLFGARPRQAGQMVLDGKPAEIKSPAEAIAAGLAYASEDRKDAGLFLEMTVAQNIAAARLKEFGSWWLDDHQAVAAAEEYRSRLRIVTPSVHQPVRNLSGGNQQKVVLSKWLLADPKVLIVDEPTRGVDVGAKAEVHRLLREVASRGTAVIVISSDLPEVLGIADRILVMREGRLAGEVMGKDATEEAVMRLASMSSSH